MIILYENITTKRERKKITNNEINIKNINEKTYINTINQKCPPINWEVLPNELWSVFTIISHLDNKYISIIESAAACEYPLRDILSEWSIVELYVVI